MLLAIILRRHLEKIHLCLTTEINQEELFDDSFTIKLVAETAWVRYTNLLGSFSNTFAPLQLLLTFLEFYMHQQIVDMKQQFDWLSCGLVELDACRFGLD